MRNIVIRKISNKYDFIELIKIFFSPKEFSVFTEEEYGSVEIDEEDVLIEFNAEGFTEKNQIKREIYLGLSQLTGTRPPWGILTGVRPVKLTGELLKKYGSGEKVFKKLTEFYLLSYEKAKLLMDICQYQQEVTAKPPAESVGVYIGIPFCPTRCLYCSFTSNQKGQEEIERYLEALITEIKYAGEAMKRSGMYPESVYIGGGTPTTLTAGQLDRLITCVEENFDLSENAEFTVEAGRPDTITPDKLAVLSRHGVDRISINPQTMKDDTLSLIGRSHSVEDIRKAFKSAKDAGNFVINADLIAGLPEETPEDFEKTLRELIDISPANITVHTLAVKKASKLIEADEYYHYKQAETVEKMLDMSKEILEASGYRPYYLYRQKHMAGALENVGYCKKDTPCLYNIRIMEEKQSILALGAGGISKKYYPCKDRLERVPNVSNYEIYIDRLDEMIERKKNNFFEEV